MEEALDSPSVTHSPQQSALAIPQGASWATDPLSALPHLASALPELQHRPELGLTDRKASLGVFGAVFGGVLGGSIPIAFGTGAGAFAASLFGASLADVVFATSFAGVLGFSAGFFGGVFGATGIAFFFGGGGIGPFGGVFGGGTGGGRFGAASLGLARLLRGSSGSGRI